MDSEVKFMQPCTPEHYFRVIEQEYGADVARGLRFRLERHLLAGLSIAGKRFLDIGGGTGVYSLYAACSGAQEVVCLEPEAAGSSQGMIEAFQRIAEKLEAKQVTLLPITFQDYQSDKPFDILFCHHAINHLNEDATIHLHRSENAQQIYLDIFQKMYQMCAPNGYLVIADASRHSIYSWLHVRSPLTPTIEWHKHQPPQVWSRLLSRVGFKQVSLRWRSPTSLGTIGQILMANRLVNFFLWAQFCLTMQKGSEF
jgi:2-polyprenyl-3-methyl-5-hydroxy-6-metoxy-1,4-benzoquinol methylase